jgi:hypothetical protein
MFITGPSAAKSVSNAGVPESSLPTEKGCPFEFLLGKVKRLACRVGW